MDLKLILKILLFGFTFTVSGLLFAQECINLNDLYSSTGCVIKSSDRHQTIDGFARPEVHVKIIKNSVAPRDPKKLFHVIGPYQIPDGPTIGLDTIKQQTDKIRAQGIDVAYYDFSASNQDLIQNKAYALITALKTIDDFRGETKPSIMLGLSMGGVVARYALTKMEDLGYAHGVKYYISYDSPHSGAHIPRSLQYIPLFFKNGIERAANDNSESINFIDDLLSLMDLLLIPLELNPFWLAFTEDPDLTAHTDGVEDEIYASIGAIDALLKDQINSPAAKQMLIKNVFSPSEGYSERNQLITELDRLGFPSGLKGLSITNIAIAKGSLTGIKFEPSRDYYINYQNSSVNHDALKGLSLKAAVVGANPIENYQDAIAGCPHPSCAGPAYYSHLVFRGDLTYKDISDIIGGDGKDNYRFHKSTSTSFSPTEHAEDIFSCSTIGLPISLAESVNIRLAEMGLGNEEKLRAQQKNSCFIPTFSALGKTHPYSSSPFDKIYGSDNNLSHIVFLENQLRLGGNGNYFEDDLIGYITDTYVNSASWSYTPIDTTIPSGSGCRWSSSATYGSGMGGGSYYEYPPIGECQDSVKAVTTTPSGSVTVEYR